MNAAEMIDSYLNKIIDLLHENFVPLSDEHILLETEECVKFARQFQCISSNKKYLMRWNVFLGTPDTVRTVFEKAEVIG